MALIKKELSIKQSTMTTKSVTKQPRMKHTKYPDFNPQNGASAH